MSSRNQYLSEAERRIAPVIYQTLGRAVERLAARDRAFEAIEKDATGALTEAGLRVDYVAVRDSSSLEVPGSATREFVVLAAARLGKARLIDNLRVSAPL